MQIPVRRPRRRRGRPGNTAWRRTAEAISALRRQAPPLPIRSRRCRSLAVLRRDCRRSTPTTARSTTKPSRVCPGRATSAIGPPAVGGATRQQSVLAGLEASASAAPEHRSDPRRRAPFPARNSSPARSKRPSAHGAAAPGTPTQRHDQAGRRRRKGSGDAGARGPSRRADAAGVPLSAHPRGAQARCGARRRQTSPTTSPSPNGPARRPSSSRAIPRTSR